MFGHGGLVKVFVVTRPVDFRKGIDGLALAVEEMFGMDPFCGAAFVFRAKRADRVKLLLWDQTGMVLVTKHKTRADEARFLATQARDSAPHFEHSTFGYNYRLSNICAAIGLGQMEVLGARVARCREIFARYKDALVKIGERGFKWIRKNRGYSLLASDLLNQPRGL